MTEGQIIEGRGGLYTVRDGSGRSYVLRAKKKFRREQMTPLVGDRVLFTPGEGEKHGWLEQILPRASRILRPPVANISLLAVVIAPSPAPDWFLVDKMLLGARMQEIRCVLVVSKCDLDQDTAVIASRDYAGAGVDLHFVSAIQGTGLEKLRTALRGQTVCFAGQSGVGKSTLLNALLGLALQTGDISRIERGRHTTRHASLITCGDISVMDTPGFSLLEFDEVMDPVLLADYYPEFAPYRGKCRFQPCYHGSEPGCAVQQAARQGLISSARAVRYTELLQQARQQWRDRYD
ncbi:MAG: ribosome small subunit-dependent GTPase A [Clostridia bacterium]|nr:ribosome small subunit-dependent GTPase A [Clostridia bacterium]